eukprot:3982405-Pyramimonas_sp.AAC.2
MCSRRSVPSETLDQLHMRVPWYNDLFESLGHALVKAVEGGGGQTLLGVAREITQRNLVRQ